LKRALRSRWIAWALAAPLLALAARPASAGVRVEEDEVIFTVRAAGAQQVYLVGDFNNWNPTVEPMEKEGDTFTISLFLVEGSYRYKFVVDGVWTVDPDNPGDPQKGSLLRLEERAGGYALSTDQPEPEKAVPTVQTAFRYIGQFRRDDGEGGSDQIADFYLFVDRPSLRGRIDLQSLDHTWKWSPLSADVDVDRVFLEAKSGRLTFTGFENDSTWTSRGPVTLVGRDGVFDYNAGFDRHGVSAELEPSDAIVLRALYTDHTGERPAAGLAVPSSAVSAFAAGSAPDTSVYLRRDTAADADQAAFEVAIDASDFAVGCVRRFDRGLFPGALADLTRSGADLPARVYDTRESRDVTLYWARLKSLFGVGATIGYARGSSDVRLLRRSSVDAEPGDALSAGADARDVDSGLPFLKSDRWTASVEGADAWWRVWWDRVSYDFDSRLYPRSSAVVHRGGARVSRALGAWNAEFAVRYTDQKYGDTPADLHVDTPARDLWLYGRDELDVVDIVAFDHDRYSDARLSVTWSAGEATAPWLPRTAASAVGGGVFDALELTQVRGRAEFAYRGDFYAGLDGRLAAYDRDEWSVKETFLSGWVEVGYRRHPVDVNLGWGFDPLVYDPVVNDYHDIGRTRWLRGALDGAVRGAGDELGARLVDRERRLEGANAVKLECVVRF
jgi:hypothetical protein